MHQLSTETIQEFKDILEKKARKEISWEEASEGAYRLAGLYDLLFKCAIEEERRQKRLEQFPKGFHLEGNGYTCAVCGRSVSNEETWYDKYGIKCLLCQKAIDRKTVPATAARLKESWYSKWELEDRFCINHHALNRFIKQGILKSRVVLTEAGKPHAQIFLIKDNKDTLPPKKLTESKLVKETRDEKEWFHSEPWFRFVDPRIALKGYKIIDHLRVVPPETVVEYSQT
jgi:hypothetical protein